MDDFECAVGNETLFATSNARNLWDHRRALVDDVFKPAVMSLLLFGMVGDILAWWVPQNLITVVGFPFCVAAAWSLWREFEAKLPDVRPYG